MSVRFKCLQYSYILIENSIKNLPEIEYQFNGQRFKDFSIGILRRGNARAAVSSDIKKITKY